MDTTIEEKASIVHLSLQTLLKIIQHANDMSPAPVAGQLLGMGHGEVLEITDMFPFATRANDEEDEESYQIDMMKALRDVNVDHASVGWYQSTSLDAPIQAAFIEAQAGYQMEIPNSCFLVYDQIKSCQGPPSVRAFRLSDDFIEAMKSNRRPSSEEFEDFLKADGIFVELPVKLSLSAMDRMMLASWADEVPAANVVGSENAHKLLIGRLAQNMIVALDESISEAARVQHYVRVVGKQCQTISIQKQKRKAENAQRQQNGEAPLPEDDLSLNLRGISDPPRLGLLYSSVQLSNLLSLGEEIFQSIKTKQAFKPTA